MTSNPSVNYFQTFDSSIKHLCFVTWILTLSSLNANEGEGAAFPHDLTSWCGNPSDSKSGAFWPALNKQWEGKSGF